MSAVYVQIQGTGFHAVNKSSCDPDSTLHDAKPSAPVQLIRIRDRGNPNTACREIPRPFHCLATALS